MKTRTQRNRQPSRKSAAAAMVRLNVPLTVKADSIKADQRTFTGLAATWAEDLGNDVIHKGAFKQTIKDWKSSSEALPLLNSHDHFDIFSSLGQALSMKETDAGLEIDWEVIDGPTGDEVLRRIKPSERTGRAIIGKMSIGFVPTKFSYEQPPGTDSFWDKIRHITEAELKEVSLVLFPMNPGAAIDATTVKQMLQSVSDADPSEIDQATREGLRRLNSKIGNLLKKRAADDDEQDEGQSAEEEEEQTPPTPGDGQDSGDAGSEDDGDEDDGEGDPEPEPKKEEEKPKGTDEPEPKQYLYAEALATRLRGTLLKSKISETTK